MWSIYFILCLILFKLYQKWSCGRCKCQVRLTDKVAIVTGANSGIGLAAAKDLANRGATVILACRDPRRAETARRQIVETTGNTQVYCKRLDLTSFQSVHEFADDILRTQNRLDILVNNAGTGKLDNSLTKDSLPIEMQVNHFGPFLLTNLLLPLLKSSAPSRIINVSSIMHWLGKVDLLNIHKPAKNSFEHSRVYSNSKLCNILITKHLSKLLDGSGVTVNCLHPGAVNSEIFKNKPAFVRFLIMLAFKNCNEGAQTTIHLAVSPELETVSGKYFADCKEAKLSSTAQDLNLASKLWEVSDRIVNTNLKSNKEHYS